MIGIVVISLPSPWPRIAAIRPGEPRRHQVCTTTRKELQGICPRVAARLSAPKARSVRRRDPGVAASILLAACVAVWRHRRARLRQFRRSPLPLYPSLSPVAVVLGWIVASHRPTATRADGDGLGSGVIEGAAVVNVLGFANAWLLAFMLAAFFAALVLVPAFVLGVRVRASEALELVCWLALAVIVLAEASAV
jgi:hypothetical protein